mmetsp:Transcript_7693/g.23449  ORF Transcript_7693/g.23449 Transcript_7693/m.23449 type:complete len:174 (+) Transcript_7693:248-769(+)
MDGANKGKGAGTFCPSGEQIMPGLGLSTRFGGELKGTSEPTREDRVVRALLGDVIVAVATNRESAPTQQPFGRGGSMWFSLINRSSCSSGISSVSAGATAPLSWRGEALSSLWKAVAEWGGDPGSLASGAARATDLCCRASSSSSSDAPQMLASHATGSAALSQEWQCVRRRS